MSAGAIIVAITLGVPAFLLAMIAFLPHGNRGLFVLGTLVFALALAFAWLVFPWHMAGMAWRQLLPFAFLLAAWCGWWRTARSLKPQPRWATWLTAAFLLGMAALLGWMDLRGLQARHAPDGALALFSPLRNGRFVVGQGGGNALLNAHAAVEAQAHALDILALNRWGLRAEPFGDPARLENYAVFGVPVFAPCDGRVLAAEDGLPDQAPPARDRQHLAGNHVLLDCRGTRVLLAHLRSGSVAVSAGQAVTTQTRIGAVGNSGNSSEPHLHLQAVRGGDTPDALEGEAVPFTLDGRHLVRGDVFGQRP